MNTMEIINPISAASCNPYVGKPVCAVLHDGSRMYGYLKGVESNRLLLSLHPVSAVAANKKKNRKKAKTAVVSPFFPAGVIAIELALIALLFAVSFLG